MVWYWLPINVYYGWTVSELESVLNQFAMQCNVHSPRLCAGHRIFRPSSSADSFRVLSVLLQQPWLVGLLRTYGHLQSEYDSQFIELQSLNTQLRRGLPMSIFSIVALAGNGFGPLIAGWIELNPRLGWRWIQWIQLMLVSSFVLEPVFWSLKLDTLVLTLFSFPSSFTKHVRRLSSPKSHSVWGRKLVISVIVRVLKMRVLTSRNSYGFHAHDLFVSRWELCLASLRLMEMSTDLMITEPIVASFSVRLWFFSLWFRLTTPQLWFGFAWGVNYCMIESISMVFTTLHDFNSGQVGLAFLSMMWVSLAYDKNIILI